MNNQIEKITDILDYLPPIGNISKTYIPVDISIDMVNAIPEDVFKPGAKFLDIACRDGRFLKAIFHRLMSSSYMQKGIITGRDDRQYNLAIEVERGSYIFREQLFGLALHKSTLNIARRNLYGTLDTDIENIIWVKEYPALVSNKDYTYSDTNIYKILKELLGKKENSDMKIDVVIGNPPYNNGMDLDFVDLAYKMSKKYVCMITPAKWQTAEADQKVSSKNINYGQFREKYVPHMSYVCFYPDCYDVFAISLSDGISWYLIDKEKEPGTCRVENRCIAQDTLNSVMDRDIINVNTLHNIGSEIIKCLGHYNKLKFNSFYEKEYNVNINKQLTVGGGGFSTREQDADGHWHVRKDIVGNGSMLFSKTEHNLTVVGNPKIIKKGTFFNNSSINIFSSDSHEECESFLSYINCKMVRFLLFINVSSQSCIGNENTWKFVPAPPSGKFDHIYTDEELYQAFNLPQKYIDAIEAIIKERK